MFASGQAAPAASDAHITNSARQPFKVTAAPLTDAEAAETMRKALILQNRPCHPPRPVHRGGQRKGPGGEGRGRSAPSPEFSRVVVSACPPSRSHPALTLGQHGAVTRSGRAFDLSVAHPLISYASPQGRSLYFRVRRARTESPRPCPVPDNLWTSWSIRSPLLRGPRAGGGSWRSSPSLGSLTSPQLLQLL